MSTPSDYINPGVSGYNIYQGATSGNPVSQTRAGINAVKLGNNLYNTYGSYVGASPNSTVSSNVGTGATGALDALGMYQGIKQGGWQGDTKAGASALQLAGLLSNNPALSAAAGYVLAPLDLYNEVENWRSGATGADAMSGAETGAAIGSIIPGIGTVIGGVVGGAAGALSSAFGPGAKDPETAGVQGVIDATSSHSNDPNIAASMQNPYLGLAGLMDRRSSTLPMYQQYGRMGEQKFTNDMVNQINQAVANNPSLAKNPQQVYNQVVAPWVNSMGSGYKNVGDAYTATTQGLLQDMTNEYLSGQAANDWKAIGGDSPFSKIYSGSPIAQAQPLNEQQNTATPFTYAAGPTNLRSVPMNNFAWAKGGSTRSDIEARLQNLYASPTFTEQRRMKHFDVGGGNGGGTTTGVAYPYVPSSNLYSPGSTNYSTFNNQDIYPSTQTDSAPVDTSNLVSGGTGDVPSGSSGGDQSSSDSAGGGSGGALSSLGSALGVSSLGQLIQRYGALAPLLAAAFSGNKPASAPATPAGYGAIPSIATPTFNRSYTQPNVANWYTYGQGPEQSFFSNNQLPNVPGVSPSAVNPATPTSAPGGTTPTLSVAPTSSSSVFTNQPYMGGQGPTVMAQGGPTFDSTRGDSYVQDPGHGNGTSDDINAKLSGGEYVMDGGTVSMLGNGSNEAGARALDQLRERIRKHAGKQLVKGKQFMKAKAPESYLRGGYSN